jgi:Cytochrome bd terminal oxidase subunit I
VNDALFLHRIHFAFTITFHYLFPQLTMGLAPLIVVLKTLAIRTGNEVYNEAAHFWSLGRAYARWQSPAGGICPGRGCLFGWRIHLLCEI